MAQGIHIEVYIQEKDDIYLHKNVCRHDDHSVFCNSQLEERINKMWYVHAMDYYSAIKINETQHGESLKTLC